MKATALTADAARLASTAASSSPLLGCLVLLTEHYERPRTPDSLIAGLPISPSGLDLVGFTRAAERAGFHCKVVRRTPRSLSPALLPALVLLEDDRACLLTAIGPDGKATIRDPETGGLAEEVALDALQARFAGYCVIVRPAPAAPDTAAEGELTPRAWFWGTVVRYWPIYLQVMILGLLVNSAGLAIPLLTMNVYDRVVPNKAIETLWVLAIGAGLVVGFDFVMRLLRAYLLDLAGRRVDVLISSRIFDHVLDLKLIAKPASAGVFANNLREFDQVRDFFTSATLVTFIDLPFAAFFIFVIWLIGGPLAWIPAVGIPTVLILGAISQVPLRRAVRQSLVEGARKHGVLVETVSALETVKLLGAQGRMQGQWERAVGAAARAGQKARLASGFAVNLASFTQAACVIAILVGGVHLIASGDLTVGALIACSLLSNRALSPMGQAANLLARYNQAATALSAINKVIRLPREHERENRPVHRPIRDGGVSFNNVTFTYPGAAQPTLQDVSITIRPGEKVAFIGRIGTGKTTIARLVTRLYDPTSGSVQVDGADARQIDTADLRRGIGFVPQDVHLFNGSLRENLVLRVPTADDASILEVARIAGVEDFIRTHPHGYDLQVGERGDRLSGGQRQAVAIARALIGDPPILIFDEPTSAMDHTTEAALIQRLGPALLGRTLLVMTHRTSMLALVNRVIVLEGGRVIADGPKEQVLQALREGGLRAQRR